MLFLLPINFKDNTESQLLNEAKKRVEQQYNVTVSDIWISHKSNVTGGGLTVDNTVFMKSKSVKGAYSYDIIATDVNGEQYRISHTDAYSDNSILFRKHYDEQWFVYPYINDYD